MGIQSSLRILLLLLGMVGLLESSSHSSGSGLAWAGFPERSPHALTSLTASPVPNSVTVCLDCGAPLPLVTESFSPLSPLDPPASCHRDAWETVPPDCSPDPLCEPTWDPLKGSQHPGRCNPANLQQELLLSDDVVAFFPTIWEDTRAGFNWNNLAILGIAGGASYGIREAWDQDVRDYVADHPKRWGRGSEYLGYLGDFRVQIPALALVYGYSLASEDAELHELSWLMIRAYTVSNLSALALKGVFNTERPTDEWMGGEYGFPSGHTASHFALAAVLDSWYGPEVGVPMYLLGGLIAWSRIDERDHDLSDVTFGAVLGYVIGKSIANRHLTGDPRVTICPWFHPIEGAPGVSIEYTF